jgi:hypothetical protein
MFRAATYYRAADYFLHGNAKDPRVCETRNKATALLFMNGFDGSQEETLHASALRRRSEASMSSPSQGRGSLR